MIVPFPTRPTTPSQWQVIGCCVWVFCLLNIGFGLYGCFKRGFDDPLARRVLMVGAQLRSSARPHLLHRPQGMRVGERGRPPGHRAVD